MKILVTFAVEAEFAPWKKLRVLRERKIGGATIYQAQIGRASVDFVVTGMGPGNARRVAEVALSGPYTICIAAGFAGALKPELQVGDVVVAEAVQMLGKTLTMECARRLHVSAFFGQAVRVKTLLTSDHLIATAEERKRLSPFADIVDMESFAVLSAAKARNVPAVAIRVVSDRFDEDMPVEISTTVDEKGRVSIRGVVRYVARHPLQLPALVRLGRKSRTAAEALAHFLEAYIKELSFKTHGYPPAELQEVAAR
jgi:adenosylhomocysteine nucleosidase